MVRISGLAIEQMHGTGIFIDPEEVRWEGKFHNGKYYNGRCYVTYGDLKLVSTMLKQVLYFVIFKKF